LQVQLPAFVAQIRRIFSAAEIREFLDELERTKFLAPTDPRWISMTSPIAARKSDGWRIPSWPPKIYCDSPAFANFFSNSHLSNLD